MPLIRSLSGTLTLLLIATVAAVSLLGSGIFYLSLSQREHAELEHKADVFIDSIDDVLVNSLWNMDRLNIEKICQAYVNDELFEQFRVIDNLGTVYFDFSRQRTAPIIKRSADIYHDTELVGHISIAFSTQNQLHRNHSLLIYGFTIITIVVFTLATVTAIFIKSLLNRLFSKLYALSDAYALGKEVSSDNRVPYQEFSPLINILQDMRDKLNAQFKDIQNAEKKYHSIFDNAAEGIFQSTLEGQFLVANPAMAQMLGYDSPEMLIATISDARQQLYVVPEQRDQYLQHVKKYGAVSNFRTQVHTKNGGTAWLSLYAKGHYDSKGELKYIEGMALDISQQKLAEEERKKLEQQLLHSQKLESVGRLAGGVAHDYNNMLSVILGYAEMLLNQLDEKDPSYEKVRAIHSAANRSAGLTKQLLAFARKQTVTPKVLDLNKTVGGMLKMLKRLLREDIELTFIPDQNLAMVSIDPTQLDQILVNLCLNARDAITGIGQIRIMTKSMYFDGEYCRQHEGVIPGHYVCLIISDTGSGMDTSVLNNIFEPFFTTKTNGTGTGLGLATVYGIIKQNKGSIDVSSEPGQGTTFTIHFPAYNKPYSEKETTSAVKTTTTRNETILLVEDEPVLLQLGQEILELLGYTVLAAHSPLEALQICSAYKQTIHLLVTDVIMPEMNGRDLANRLLEERPALKCLYVSGYTTDILAPQGILDEDINFLQKPFTQNTLATKLEEILNP